MGPDTLRAYRRNAVHVRQALARLREETGRVQVDGGYLQNEGLIERYKQLSIPVRRALNPTDRASFAQALGQLHEEMTRATGMTRTKGLEGSGVPGAQLEAVAHSWAKLQTELDTIVGLGGGKVPRRQILSGWLEAAAFYDKLERDRAYDTLMDQWGKAAEGIGAQLMEDAARVIVDLDDVVADALGEPEILPPPIKTPPPPPDPKESLWKRWFGR